ncbi:MAG: alanine racemase [Flavobacteriaceae bacterium CG_4_8_14_3_um_filter_34_10]|nr:alanine racemase [Flavobacteriia bacterium]PIV50824.1 MAG: alanine racemase [Flavobacteriaceae bacterium CG02_land_8_20_14_3_00_34_13]PIX08348.1 MAG: alanine racemase [Flavobacteriaceae bacterium CG_4_8_14_3_um_filter_34_10]PIZ07209.1 MAG: alanine racemase [Flavobacteriaceae bacterium CG_4_10_14_0_8_um_filter_34_31]PJC07146.1 MAG: alanine racemase [Flavobacteriaceae bacterium CG_4_9_14_0_8_um_filter_34_30]
MPKATETTLEIDLRALTHNFQYITSKLQKGTKLMAVVKASAYGSDSVVVAKKLEELGIDYFAVAYASEGVVLRESGVQTPILVLHPQTINFDKIVQHCLEPSIYSPLMLDRFIAFAESENLENYPIHLKINTGMNRIGYSTNEVNFILEAVSKTKAVKIKSIFSHLAASEDIENRDFAEKQINDFKTASEYLMSKLDYSPLRHTLNTSGIFNFPNAQFNMVRSGIGLYGFGNCEKENKNLRPIATLKTIISQIHTIRKGESVGYNFGFIAEKEMKTATLPLGHADGINRAYGKGNGFVTIHGKKAPMIGNICMDMLMVDITNIACEEGDEVQVFGEKNATAEEFASRIHSISYEIITAISPRVKRIFTY